MHKDIKEPIFLLVARPMSVDVRPFLLILD